MKENKQLAEKVKLLFKEAIDIGCHLGDLRSELIKNAETSNEANAIANLSCFKFIADLAELEKALDYYNIYNPNL